MGRDVLIKIPLSLFFLYYQRQARQPAFVGINSGAGGEKLLYRDRRCDEKQILRSLAGHIWFHRWFFYQFQRYHLNDFFQILYGW